MFDYNCDLAQEYGVYKDLEQFERAKYVSSVNIACGFHSGDPISIKKALEFAKENNLSIGAHIGFQDIAGFGKNKMFLENDALEALIVYQLSALSAYAESMSLEIENVRLHGAMSEMFHEDIEYAKCVATIIKKFNPWLNLFVKNFEIKKTIEEEIGINCVYEEIFKEGSSLREFREGVNKPDSLHFVSAECVKRAYEVKKPTPVNYNRVGAQI